MKSLEWLKARSKKAVLNAGAVQIAMKAKSPTDAFKLAQGQAALKCMAEEVRYLAMIRRDYGKSQLKGFVRLVQDEDKDLFFQSKIGTALTFFGQLSQYAIMKSDYGRKSDVSFFLSEQEMWFAHLLKDILREVRERFLFWENTDLLGPTIFSAGQIANIALAGGSLDENRLRFLVSLLSSMGKLIEKRTGAQYLHFFPVSILAGCNYKQICQGG